MTNNPPKKHLGSCHCGAVTFEATIDATKGTRCNCRVCTKLNPLGVLAKPGDVRVLTGESELSEFGRTAAGKRYFCKHCGVYMWSKGYLEELGGDYASINLQALDDIDVDHVATMYWDGRHDNWQAGPSPKPYARFKEPSAASAATTEAR
jgi:hypothetical protein